MSVISRCFKHGLLVLVVLLVLLPGSQISLAVSGPSDTGYLEQAYFKGNLLTRWHDETDVIYVYMETGHDLPGWQDEFNDLVKQAFSEWQEALEQRLRFEYITHRDNTDVVVKWHRRPSGHGMGLQSTRWKENHFTDADVILSLQGADGKQLDAARIKSLALHEVGHLLGIRGHSNHPDDIMAAEVKYTTQKLTPRDIATVRALYRQKPDVTNAPGIRVVEYKRFIETVERGITAQQRKDYATAYNLMVEARQLYPDSTRIDYFIGIMAMNAGYHDVALRHFQKVVEGQLADHMQAECQLGNILMFQAAAAFNAGNHEVASQILKQAKRHFANVMSQPELPTEVRRIVDDSLSQIQTNFPLEMQ